jgi:hypothetical protein
MATGRGHPGWRPQEQGALQPLPGPSTGPGTQQVLSECSPLGAALGDRSSWFPEAHRAQPGLRHPGRAGPSAAEAQSLCTLLRLLHT